MSRSFHRDLCNARAKLGLAIQCSRQRAGYSRPKLAQMLGYKNISKGAWRISTWEKGDASPSDQQTRALVECLGDDSLQCLSAKLYTTVSRHQSELVMLRRVNHAAMAKLWSYIDGHRDTLCSNTLSASTATRWKSAYVPGAYIGIAHLGSTPLTLGTLLNGWSTGPLLEGGTIFQISGSPLSGRHTLVGIREKKWASWSYPKGFLKLAIPFFERAEQNVDTTLSPLDILCHLDDSPVNIPIYDAHGQVCWLWKPGLEEARQPRNQVEAKFEGPGLESYTLSNGTTVHPGYALGPNKELRLMFHWPIPPHVAQAALRHSRHNRPTESDETPGIPPDFLDLTETASSGQSKQDQSL